MILFKAEASAWTPEAVQLQQVWVDPVARRQGHGKPGSPRSARPAARRACRTSACSCGPRTSRRSPSTSRSACGGSSTTAACCCRAGYTAGSVSMQRLILVRHAHALSNVRDAVSGLPPGRRAERARRRGRRWRCARRSRASRSTSRSPASSSARRRRWSSRSVGRDVPRLVLPDWNEIHFGRFEAGPLAAYSDWAWTSRGRCDLPGWRREPRRGRGPPGRRARGAPRRVPRQSILAVGHALPVRYVLDAVRRPLPRGDGSAPCSTPCPYRLSAAEQVAAAGRALRRWSAAPAFAGRPQA